MKRALILLAVLPLGAAPALAVSPYRTDQQAEAFIKNGLKSWAGIDLTQTAPEFVWCTNGWYSAFEKRTGRHYPQDRKNRWGENLFRSFACSFAVGERSFDVYVVTRVPKGWTVKADR